MISKKNSKWVLKFSDGREETFPSKAAAEKRENQVKQIKYLKENKVKKKAPKR